MVKCIAGCSKGVKRRIAFTLLIITCMCLLSEGQDQSPVYYYRILFSDKGDKRISDFNPSDILSSPAIRKRQKNKIAFPDFHDLPVYKGYLEKISSLGFTLHCKSKWMNSALFTGTDPDQNGLLLSLGFVRDVKIVKKPLLKKHLSDKLFFETYYSDFPPYDNPVEQVNGSVIQKAGFTGNGILIAVMDGGFTNAVNISSLNELRNRMGIKGTYDFVKKNSNVYDFNNHGTAVLSVLAGSAEGSLQGSAPGADYLLLRTEDTGSEFPAEEDFWTAAAEYADSCGADIITSSLGYFTFDDPSMSYKFSDMDGRSAFITRAAGIAASKGILVVNSAGNERGGIWNHIIAPADGDSVLAVGAVDGYGAISSFSSPGPSYDGRIKPDVVAQGVSVPVQTDTDISERANGTSFSCPVISGLCACLMEAVPEASTGEILSAVKTSSDRALNPDSDYGYGIPDIEKAFDELQEKYVKLPSGGTVAGPNPFSEHLNIYFKENPEWVSIKIFNISGIPVYSKNYGNYISRLIVIDDINYLSGGIYFLKINTSHGSFNHKVFKVNRLP